MMAFKESKIRDLTEKNEESKNFYENEGQRWKRYCKALFSVDCRNIMRVKVHKYFNFLIHLPFDVLADLKKFQQLTKNAPKMQQS